MRKFIVADNAPPWVAGRRVNPGDVLTLSELDASYEVARGLLLPVDEARVEKRVVVEHAPAAPVSAVEPAVEEEPQETEAEGDNAPKGRRKRRG